MRKRLARIGLFGAGFAGISSIYYWVDPSKTTLLPCPFYYLTGFHCPGCGSQRAIHHLLHGEFQIAFWTNPLLILSLMLALPFALIKLASYLLEKDWKYNWFGWNKLVYSYLGMVLIFWIARNLGIYPLSLLSPEVFP